MAAKRVGDQYSIFLDDLILLSKKIDSEKELKVETSVISAKTSLIYIQGN
jgi:hypothetical protein